MNEQQQCQIGPCRQLEERQISRAEGGEDLPSNCQDPVFTGDVKRGACLHLTSEDGHGKTKILLRFQ